MISVLGSGVAGLCAATALAEAGYEVEVITPATAPAPASHLAGGMLAPFCEGESAPEMIVSQGQQALDWWTGHVPGVERCGTLVVTRPRDAAELTRWARATRGHSVVNPATLEPDLQGRFARGLYYGGEAHLTPRHALGHLREHLLANGTAFREGPPQGRIIDCRGIASTDVLPELRPVRGEMVELHAPGVTLTRPLRLLHPRFPCYIVPRGNGRYMLGATMVETAHSGPVTARALMELLSAAYAIHPGFAEAEVIATGTGLRPSFPDNIPRLRRTGDRIHMNGMYRHGFLMAPILATALVKMMTEEEEFLTC